MTKLQKRMEQYKIPPVPYRPFFDQVVICRIQPEKKTAGGIHIPDAHVHYDPIGVLVAWSSEARDRLESRGAELGDIVWFGAWAGDERSVYRPEGEKGREMLLMDYQYINGDVDVRDAIEAGELEEVQGPDGRWTLKRINKKRKAA